MRVLTGTLAVVALLVVGALTACVEDFTAWGGSDAGPDDLVGRTFLSVSVVEEGQPRELVPYTRVKVSFTEHDGDIHVGWSAGCNSAGSAVIVSADRLRLVDDTLSTLILCPDDLAAQDGWVRSLFEAGPHWELSGERLRLEARDVVIEFEEDAG